MVEPLATDLVHAIARASHTRYYVTPQRTSVALEANSQPAPTPHLQLVQVALRQLSSVALAGPRGRQPQQARL